MLRIEQHQKHEKSDWSEAKNKNKPGKDNRGDEKYSHPNVLKFMDVMLSQNEGMKSASL